MNTSRFTITTIVENGYMTEEKYKMLKTLGFDLKKSAQYFANKF